MEYTWLKVFAEAEHNPVPSDVQKRRGRSNETGAITAPDSVVNTTNAVLIHKSKQITTCSLKITR